MKGGNQKDMPRLLIVGAFGPEIDELASSQATARDGDRDYEVLEAGIGSVAAAVSVQARLLDGARPEIREILFLGSAGAYDTDLPIGPGRFAFSNRFCKRDLAALENRANQPAATGDVIECAIGQRTAVARAAFDVGDLRDGLCNSTDSVSLVAPPAGDCDYENLECFGVAWVCRRYAIPFGAFLALTNSVGPEGSAQWRVNHRSMSLELQGAIARYLL